MERVKKGEMYWYIQWDFTIDYAWDDWDVVDEERYGIGNYFHTAKEAEAMASKIRKVLKGADVIEMPSEKEIEAVAYRHCGPLAEWSGSAVNAFIEATDWLKSKLIKED